MQVEQNLKKRFIDGFHLFDTCTLNKQKSLPKYDMGKCLKMGENQDGHRQK
jgi:hypothetical protein